MLNRSPFLVLSGHSSGLYLTPICNLSDACVAATRLRQREMMPTRVVIGLPNMVMVRGNSDRSNAPDHLVEVGESSTRLPRLRSDATSDITPSTA
jgi:hypothetical protein